MPFRLHSDTRNQVKCIKPCRKLKENAAYYIDEVTLSSAGKELVHLKGLSGWFDSKRFAPLDTLDKFLMLRPAIKGAQQRRWKGYED